MFRIPLFHPIVQWYSSYNTGYVTLGYYQSIFTTVMTFIKRCRCISNMLKYSKEYDELILNLRDFTLWLSDQ